MYGQYEANNSWQAGKTNQRTQTSLACVFEVSQKEGERETDRETDKAS